MIWCCGVVHGERALWDYALRSTSNKLCLWQHLEQIVDNPTSVKVSSEVRNTIVSVSLRGRMCIRQSEECQYMAPSNLSGHRMIMGVDRT